MILFDPRTLSDWKHRSIHDISVYFYESGCAGTKIQVQEGVIEGLDTVIQQDDLHFYVKKNELSLIDGGRITHAWGKWLFTSDTVNTRCGCGSSFSLKSDSPIQDKIARMKLAMKQKKEGIHE